MSEFEKRNPITEKTSYSLWQAMREGWLEALKWVIEKHNDCGLSVSNMRYIEKQIKEEIDELEKNK